MLRLRRNNLRYPIVKPMSRDSMQRGKRVSTSCFFVMAGLFASPACGGGRRARRSAAGGGSHHAHRILVGHPTPALPRKEREREKQESVKLLPRTRRRDRFGLRGQQCNRCDILTHLALSLDCHRNSRIDTLHGVFGIVTHEEHFLLAEQIFHVISPRDAPDQPVFAAIKHDGHPRGNPLHCSHCS